MQPFGLHPPNCLQVAMIPFCPSVSSLLIHLGNGGTSLSGDIWGLIKSPIYLRAFSPLTRSLIANVGEVLTRRAEPLRWHDSPSIGQTGRKVRRGVTVTLGANSWLPTEECLRMCRISRDLQIHSTTAQTLPVRHQPHSKNSRDSLWNQRVKPGTRPDMVHANGSASR